jgi:hypothetical protein
MTPRNLYSVLRVVFVVALVLYNAWLRRTLWRMDHDFGDVYKPQHGPRVVP